MPCMRAAEPRGMCVLSARACAGSPAVALWSQLLAEVATRRSQELSLRKLVGSLGAEFTRGCVRELRVKEGAEKVCVLGQRHALRLLWRSYICNDSD